MKQISMKVNQANLVKSLRFSFTNKTTVLGELMQNARRANATQVVFEFAPETRILRVMLLPKSIPSALDFCPLCLPAVT